MVNAVYDHIVAIIIVGAIFVSSVVALPYVNLRNLLAVDQQQLRSTALNILNAMLMDLGYPTDWGSQVNETFYFQSAVVERFGLASATYSTFYSLDPDKVQRLNPNNPLGSLSYDQVCTLLKLENYGFHFGIVPPFNVTNIDGTKIDDSHSPISDDALENGVLDYSVKVSYLDGRPIYNATILATAIFTSDVKGNETSTLSLDPIRTDILGTCSQNATLVMPPDELTSVVVILRVSVSEVSTLVLTFGESPPTILDINMVGDTIILTEPKEAPPSAIELKAIYVQGSQGTPWLLYEGQGPPEDLINTGAGQFALWNRTFSGLSDCKPAILFLSVHKNGKEIIVAEPCASFACRTSFEFGNPVVNAGVAVKIQRSVIIADMQYFVELWIWKEWT